MLLFDLVTRKDWEGECERCGHRFAVPTGGTLTFALLARGDCLNLCTRCAEVEAEVIRR